MKGHVILGGSSRHFGIMAEYLRVQSDGFRHLPDNSPLGFRRNDFIGKALFKTDRDEGINHSLLLKVEYADENSHETYMGLTKEDVTKDPLLRYPASKLDEMKTKHFQLTGTYWRNWYKANDVRIGIAPKEKLGLKEVIEHPELYKPYFDLVNFTADSSGEAIIMRANNRDYFSQGIQSKAMYTLRIGSVYQNIELGVRYHEDGEGRHHWDDGYAVKKGEMKIVYKGKPGEQSNTQTTARAWAGYISDRITWDGLTVTLGARYENVRLLRKNYTATDLKRTGGDRIEVANAASVIIPGVGIHYNITPQVSILGGVHKGFAPPRTVRDQKAESSLNYELGTRFSAFFVEGELIGFYNRYSNMLGSDLTAQGGQGTLDQFTADEARVYGIEALLRSQPLPKTWKFRLPMQVSYTYTDSQMFKEFESSAWGRVLPGDEIPYIFKHSLNVRISLEYKYVDLTYNIKYNGDMRTVPGQGSISEREKVPAHIIMDLSANYYPLRGLKLYVTANNLTNARYITSRHPFGLRSGRPLAISGGISYAF